MPACARCGRENPDENRFCGVCGERLEAPAPRFAQRTITIVFSDIGAPS